MLYTRSDGQRMIRVFNYMWRVCKNLYAYFRSTDVENYIQFKMRNDLTQLSKLGPLKLREKYQNDLVDMLHNYRTHCANQTNPSQLVLPETLTLLPLYILSTIKNPAFQLLSQHGSCTADRKIAEKYKIISGSLEEIASSLYPRLYDVTDIGTDDADFGEVNEETGYMEKPMALPCKFSKLANF